MKIKQIIAPLTLSLIVAGCASYVAVNSECNVPSRPFTDVVACINNATAGSTNDYMTMYALRANRRLAPLEARVRPAINLPPMGLGFPWVGLGKV